MFGSRFFLCAALIATCFGLADVRADMTLDLTASGAICTINDAYFVQGSFAPAGSGKIESFVRIDGGLKEQGYNTDARRNGKTEFDEKTDEKFTRSLRLTDVPVVTLDGFDYREFLLDINEAKGPEKGEKSLLSLDKIEIYLADTGDRWGYPELGTKVFDLDGSGDNWIKLDAAVSQGPGSGSADMLAYIPNTRFSGGDFVYLYSKFGENYKNDGGYEEWSVRQVETPPAVHAPAPGAALLSGIGLSLAGWFRRRQRS
ncbi:MAG: hypothetical protein GXY19_01495 [Phycisphaerae bacterium]|nr:hypothetical protein [Phycisphaerae bacterium]